jgi:dipeptide/tripeptide permease
MRYSKADSAAAVQSWSASCYATALLGAVVADSALGRFRTILLFCVLYLAGMVVLTCCAGLVPGWAPAPGEDVTPKQTGARTQRARAEARSRGDCRP